MVCNWKCAGKYHEISWPKGLIWRRKKSFKSKHLILTNRRRSGNLQADAPKGHHPCPWSFARWIENCWKFMEGHINHIINKTSIYWFVIILYLNDISCWRSFRKNHSPGVEWDQWKGSCFPTCLTSMSHPKCRQLTFCRSSFISAAHAISITGINDIIACYMRLLYMLSVKQHGT